MNILKDKEAYNKKYLLHYEFKKYFDDALKVVVFLTLPLAVIGIFFFNYPKWFAGLDYGLSFGVIAYFLIMHPRLKRGKTKAGYRATYEGKMSLPVLLGGYAIAAVPRFLLTLGFDILATRETLGGGGLFKNEYFLNIFKTIVNPFFILGLLIISFIIYLLYYKKPEVTVKEYTMLMRQNFTKSGGRLTEEGCYSHFVRDFMDRSQTVQATYEPESSPEKGNEAYSAPIKDKKEKRPSLLIEPERRRNKAIKERTSGE